MKLKNVSIKVRLHGTFVLSIVSFLCVLLFAVLGLYRIGNEAEELSRPRSDTVLLGAAVAHQKWAMSVQSYVLNEGNVPLSVPTDGTQCDFGKWFYGGGRDLVEKELPGVASIFKDLDKDHSRLHSVAALIRTAVTNNDIPKAHDLLEKEVVPLLAHVDNNLNEALKLVNKSTGETLARLLGYIDTDVKTILILSFLVTVVVGVLVNFSIRAITSPLARLDNAANKVSLGVFQKADVNQLDEVGRVATSFNQMVTVIKERVGILNGLISGMTTPFAIFDTNDRLTHVNSHMLLCWGRKDNPEEFYGMSSAEFFYNDKGRTTLVRRVLDESKSMIGYSQNITNQNNEEKSLSLDAAPLLDLDGVLMGVFTLHHDLTEIRQQQDRIAALNDHIFYSANEAKDISHRQSGAFEALVSQLNMTLDLAGKQEIISEAAARTLEEVTNAMSQMTKSSASTRQNMEHANKFADEGAEIVERSLQCMARMSEQTGQVAHSMEALDGHAIGIGRILDLITDVADQTNLLALNAAIEAARAGDAGRGFAVVADEVRKLAEKTMQATNEVAQAVNAIQAGVRNSTKATHDAVRLAHETADLARTSSERLAAIREMTHSTAESMRTMAQETEMQAKANDSVLHTVVDISHQAKVTCGAMQTSSSHVVALQQLSEDLWNIINNMRTERRLTPRYKLIDPYTMSLTSPHGKKFEIKLLDISQTGLRAHSTTTSSVAKGDLVSLYATTAPYNKLFTNIHATVIWVDEKLIGLGFVDEVSMDIAHLSQGVSILDA